MADVFSANRTDFSLVADAIRAKGGTAAQMAWPDGFKAAVEAIKTGGDTGPYKKIEFRTWVGSGNGTYPWWNGVPSERPRCDIFLALTTPTGNPSDNFECALGAVKSYPGSDTGGAGYVDGRQGFDNAGGMRESTGNVYLSAWYDDAAGYYTGVFQAGGIYTIMICYKE